MTRIERDALVICTRNRAQDLERCLRSVEIQSRVPTETLVVDSSDGDEALIVVQEFADRGNIPNLRFVHTARGLTKQRNFALDMLSSGVDIVHFIDDDVELAGEYVNSLLTEFEASPHLVGAGGMVLGGNREPPKRLAIWGGRESTTPGRVLPSGFNIGAHETPTAVGMEWLPGCSMSFRRQRIQGLRFDEERVGYAIGEDVDFGLRASAVGELRHVPSARLVHNQSPVNRIDRPEIMRLAVRHRWTLAADGLGRVKRTAVVYGTLTESIHQLLSGVRHANGTSLKCAHAVVLGLLDILRRGHTRGH